MKLSYILLVLFSTQMVLSQVNDTITTNFGLNYRYTAQGEGEEIYFETVGIQYYTFGSSTGEALVSSRDINDPFGFEHPSNRLIKGTIGAPSLSSLGDSGVFIMPYYLEYGEKGDLEVPPKKQ